MLCRASQQGSAAQQGAKRQKKNNKSSLTERKQLDIFVDEAQYDRIRYEVSTGSNLCLLALPLQKFTSLLFAG